MTYASQVGEDSNANMASGTTRVAADLDTHQDFQPASKGYQGESSLDMHEGLS